MSKVFIVEDDKKIREELSIFLKNNGYEVESAIVFDNVIDKILASNSDILLLDINLPNNDGYYICKQIRHKSSMPILIVTSRNTEIDELMSMNLGADDFITKPYNTQILLARMESILKRAKGEYGIKDVIEYQGIKVNISKSNMEYNSKAMDLTKNELKILYFLISKKGNIVSRDDIMRYLWDSEMFVDDNTLTVNINRLRKKLEEIGISEFIETKRGQGYIIY